MERVGTREASRMSFRTERGLTLIELLIVVAIIGIIAFSLVYFTMTFPISVFYYPIALAVIGVLMRMVIGNIQHSA